MSKQLLFYENATPVSSKRHREWSVKSGRNYGFAKTTNSVPLMAIEFPNAAIEYPIVFASSGDNIFPVAILGMQDKNNLFIDDEGTWKAKYIPAFVRRYPFVFSATDDGKTLMLCIDESFSGCNEEGIGERLFDAEGERTQYLKTILGFVEEYQAHFQRTQVFCNKLKELDLFEPMQAQFSLNTGQQLSLTGFMGINKAKLNALPGDKLEELAKTRELEMAYTHLQSLNNFTAMAERGAGQQAASETEEAEAEPPIVGDAKEAGVPEDATIN